MELKITTVQAILSEIESLGPDHSQSTSSIIEVGMRFSGWVSFTGQQMAIAKRALNDKKTQMYNQFVFNHTARGITITPTMAKDYVSGKCAEEQYNYDLCERCNRSLVHVLDFLRSALSTLKQEMIISQQSQFNT